MDKDNLLYHYFSNTLSKAQESALNQLLKTDEEFKLQFEYEQSLKRAITKTKTDDLKNKLKKFESTIGGNTKSSRSSSFIFFKFAASLILFVSSGWLVYSYFFSFNGLSTFDDYYVSYPNTVFQITRSDTQNSIERKAFLAYETRDYKSAIEHFNKLENKNYLPFYRGLSFLALGNNEKAKYELETVIEQRQVFVAEAYWYLALLYVKEENKKQALEKLNYLISKYDFKKVSAKKLLDELN